MPPPSRPGTRRPVGKPLLASEALMEDLAPVEPSRNEARFWCLAVGVVFLASSVLPLVRLRGGGVVAALPWLFIGTVALLTGALRVPYRTRAVAMIVLGLFAGPVGLEGTALASAAGGVAWGSVRMLAAIALGAALLFRARYRAYAGARLFLAAGFLAALPFVAFTVVDLVRQDFQLAHVGSLVALGAIAASAVGFMGAQTTGAGTFLAPLVAVGLTSELVLRAIADQGVTTARGTIGIVATAAAFLAASALGALGVFQFLAWRFAADARRIDLHPPAEEEPPRSERGDDEWSATE